MKTRMKWSLRYAAVMGLALLVMLAVNPRAGAAQEQPEGVRAPVGNKALISANPFLLLGEWFNADFEYTVSEHSTLGGQFSWVTTDDDEDSDDDQRYRSLNAIWRYYPQGAPLVGFYFGPRTGFYRIDDNGESYDGWGVGFELGYNWLLGEDRHFAISIGVGANRVWAEDLDGGSAFVPTVKLVNIGWAF